MTSADLPTAGLILETLERNTVPVGASCHAGLLDPVLALHRNNRRQWDREDDARTDDAGDAIVAAAKRDIDGMNAERHQLIEGIDRRIRSVIDLREDAPVVTESPGMAIDRLSVLVIRLASTESRARTEVPGAASLGARVPGLRTQVETLTEAIGVLLGDLVGGKRRFVPYESFKLYGPPSAGSAR